MILGAIISGGAGLLGGFLDSKESKKNRKQIAKTTKFTDQSISGPFGSVLTTAGGLNRFSDNALNAGLRSDLGGLIGPSLGLGALDNLSLAQSPDLRNALGSTDLTGSLGLINSIGAVGPNTSGAFGNPLLGLGVNNQLRASDFQGLLSNELSGLRAAAEPEQNRLFNKLQDRLFATGQLGSTGGGEQLRGFFEAQNQQDLNFQNEAFNRALSRGNFLGNLGASQIGLGSGLLDQNFSQLLQSQASNRQLGLDRINAATSVLGFGSDLFRSNFDLGTRGFGIINELDRFGLDSILGLRGAGNNQIAAATGGALGLANTGNSGLGSLIASAGNTIGSLFNRRNNDG